MAKYRVAVATNDGENVNVHFGHAAAFDVYEVDEESGKFEIPEIRPATYLLSLSVPDGYVLARKVSVTLPVESCKAMQTVPLNVAMGETWENQILGIVLL